MNFPLYIAKRYILSKSKSNAINIISVIALGGIIVGTLSLFVVLSVFSGLREYSVQFTNNFDPDLKVITVKGKSFSITTDEEKKIKSISGIATISKTVEERVLFSFNGKQQVTYIKGVDREFQNSNGISKNLFNGQWLKPETPQAVIGYGISQKLSLGLFDFNNPLEVYVPKPKKGQIQSVDEDFNVDYLMPVGIYAVSEELDSKYVFVDLNLSQQLMGFLPNEVTGIEIKTQPNADKEKIKTEIETLFQGKIKVKTREELNSTLHKMLNTENIAVYLIFTLVIIVALFNLVGALIMIIIEKKNNLKTLLNLGAEVSDLRKVFLLQGVLLSFFGGLIGLILGTIIVYLQQKFSLIMITDSLAYPVVFEISNLLIVLSTILFLGFLAAFIASGRVSKKLLN
ncbi:MAG: ABC transporter permease [Flavobacterium sp.]|nr:ABC transporter permease [Flavobacterium sp.]